MNNMSIIKIAEQPNQAVLGYPIPNINKPAYAMRFSSENVEIVCNKNGNSKKGYKLLDEKIMVPLDVGDCIIKVSKSKQGFNIYISQVNRIKFNTAEDNLVIFHSFKYVSEAPDLNEEHVITLFNNIGKAVSWAYKRMKDTEGKMGTYTKEISLL